MNNKNKQVKELLYLMLNITFHYNHIYIKLKIIIITF